MKSYLGMLIITAFYLILGVSFDTKPKGMGWVIILYPILIALCLFSMYLIKKKQSILMLIIWVLISTIPTGLYTIIARSYSPHGGGFITFNWDDFLWELIMPFFIGVSQFIIILVMEYVKKPGKVS